MATDNPQPSRRRLAAILAADIAGYSRLIGADEDGTVQALKGHQAVILPMISEAGGRIIDTAGDGVLSEFASVLAAVSCALQLQKTMEARNHGTPTDRAMRFRIGVHLGDIIFDEARIYGDGINVASRLQALADPGGVVISGSVYTELRGRIEAHFEDLGERELKNIVRPVRAYALQTKEVSRETPASPTIPASAEQPALAVLPFSNMSGDPEQDYFADGITEDIITALSRAKWFSVIARNSSFVYKGKAVDVRQVGRELGVRYVLEGSVRKGGNRLRITGQLIETEDGKHVWADKYDRSLEDIFAVQDEIAENVVAAIEPHLYAVEGFRARSRPPESLDAWGLVIRALLLVNKVGKAQNQEAQVLLLRAIEIEPDYARAHAVLAWAKWWATLCDWEADRKKGFFDALTAAERALTLDPDEPWARMVSGLALSQAGHHDRAIEELESAIRLNPSFALAHSWYGLSLLRAGQVDRAIAMTQKARKMSPMDSFAGIYTTYYGLALLGAKRFAEALPIFRAAIAAFPEFTGHYNALVSCCGHLGLLDDAKQYLAHRNKIGPPLAVATVRRNLAKFAHCDIFIEGLTKAGVPEGD